MSSAPLDGRTSEDTKHFGTWPKYLTLQMKWQNVDQNAKCKMHQNVRRQPKKRWATGYTKTEPKDATRVDSEKIERTTHEEEEKEEKAAAVGRQQQMKGKNFNFLLLRSSRTIIARKQQMKKEKENE